MKTLLLCVALLAASGGDREKGLQLYRDGHFTEAAAAFRAAIENDGDSAELQWNLALASWRAGDLAAAETAVEKYAAMASDARTELHAGLLGALRYDEAKALEAKADAMMAVAGAPPTATPGTVPEDPLPVLESALEKAMQSKVHFLRGAKANPTPELLRNTERTLRAIDELQKKIDELKKQRQEQKKDDDKKDGEKKPDDKKDQKQDDKKSDDKKDGDKKPDEKNDQQKGDPKQDPQKSDEKPDGKGEEKPEPKPGDPKDSKSDEQKPQPSKPEDSKSGDKPPAEQPEPESKPGEAKKDEKPRTDAPGEAVEGKEMSPEQTQRVMEQLKDLEQKLKAYRALAKSGRPPVARDW